MVELVLASVFLVGSMYYVHGAGFKGEKSIYYVLASILAPALFYILHNLDLRRLSVFREPAILVNMTLLFLLVLLFPIFNHFAGVIPGFKLHEKRKITPEPVPEWKTLLQYPREYTPYYNDHFVLRNHFIYLQNFLEVKWFGVSPIPKVLVGRDGWLFIAREKSDRDCTEYFRAVKPFTSAELEHWKNILEQRRKWLADRGIHYLFVIAPNKNTIYPEYMPRHIRKTGNRSRMDQLLEYLENHSKVPVLDLRPALRAAKKEYPVYARTDTHWSEYGAYIVHREIIEHISQYRDFKAAVPLPLSRFKINRETWGGGDLAKMLSMPEVLTEEKFKLRPKSPLNAKGGKLKRLSRFVKRGYSECKGALPVNIVMVHDSFYKKLKPYLSECFVRVQYIWDWNMNFYPHVIEQEKPALVIDEMAERFLLDQRPINPKELASR